MPGHPDSIRSDAEPGLRDSPMRTIARAHVRVRPLTRSAMKSELPSAIDDRPELLSHGRPRRLVRSPGTIFERERISRLRDSRVIWQRSVACMGALRADHRHRS